MRAVPGVSIWVFGGLLLVSSASKDIAMNRYVTVGLAVVAGAALFEAALIPGVVIGGAAVLMPKYLPGLRRRLWPLNGSRVRTGTKPAVDIRARRVQQAATAAALDQTGIKTLQGILPKLAFGQAIAKTITYRIVVTGLDFTVKRGNRRARHGSRSVHF